MDDIYLAILFLSMMNAFWGFWIGYLLRRIKSLENLIKEKKEESE